MQRVLFLCLALLAVLTFQPIQAQQTYLPVSSKSKTAVEHYTQGMDTALNAKFALMGKHMSKATAEDPGLFMAYFQQAMISWWFQDPKALEEAYVNAMACKGEMNKTEQICKQLLMALKADPSADQSSFGKKLAEAAPNVVEAHIWHGHLSDFTNNPKVSLPAYQKAATLAPGVAGIQNMLGYTYMADGQMGPAEKAFDKYIELAPGEANAYDSKGDFLMASGKYAEAEKMFRKAFQMDESFTGSPNKAEVAAAMQVAAQETESFMKSDYDAWAKCWKKGPAVSFAYTDANGAWTYQGWQDVSQAARSIMAEESALMDAEITRSNFNWRVREDNVWVTYEQTIGDNTTREMRVLDKVDGEYRMLLMNAIGKTSFEAKARIENKLKSVSVFKVPDEADTNDLFAVMNQINAAIDNIGYPDAGYQMWTLTGEEGSVSQFVIEGLWPNQEAYDLIHEHELYKSATKEAEAKMKELERVSYNRFKRME